MLKLDYRSIPDRVNLWLSIIANVISIVVPFVTYFVINDVLIYIISILLFITVIRNFHKTHKMYNLERKFSRLSIEFEQQRQQRSQQQEIMDNLIAENKSYNEKLLRIHDDLLDGKVPSDVLINYYINEVDDYYVKYIKMYIDVHIIYDERLNMYDVKYQWIVYGQNPSQEKPLSKLCFIISGDSAIKDNSELELNIELQKPNGEWQKVNGYVSGSDRIKYIHVDMNIYEILPSYTFCLRFSYVWPRSFNAVDGDRFSFGSNTFSSTEPYILDIKVHGDKKCFGSAKQQIRNVLDNYEIKEQFSELRVVEADDENIVTALLPASETDSTIYITLAQ